MRTFKKVKQRPGREWFYYDGTPELAYQHFDEYRNGEFAQKKIELEYQLRPEQERAVQETLQYANANKNGEFLWNAKPRFGKTLTTYDLARRMKAKNVLIVTNRPAIANSWFDDFETFIAWQTDYRFVSTTDTLKERPVLTREEFLIASNQLPVGRYLGCIAFISLQDLKGAIGFGGNHDKLGWVKELQWDLLVIDEAHEGVDTFKADIAFNNVKRKFTLHLSGTPFKAIANEKFSQEQIYNWTYADEQEAKAAWPVEDEANNPYEGLPQLNMFTYQMSQMITDEVNKGAEIDGKEIDFAFDLNEFFNTNSGKKFIHEAEVKKWLDTLTRNEKYPFSTPELRDELKHTFWFLNRVASARALKKLLNEHPVFKDYEVVLAAGGKSNDDGKTDDDDFIITQDSLNRVREAIKNFDRTITLSVGQLTTGVTVPEWTAVLILSNLKSPSMYMQAAFRAQNPWSYDVDGKKYRKQNAYVFDFAPERTLIIYDAFANNLDSITAGGGGTTEERSDNIKTLLNFFPVIAEDDLGKMTELDVRQVLTIPKTIKAQEVVKRGFMSNFLFQNISAVFASKEACKILEQLDPVPVGKIVSVKTAATLNTQNITVDNDGKPLIDSKIVVAATDARFGEKVYASLSEKVENFADATSESLTKSAERVFTDTALNRVQDFAKDHSVTVSQARQVVKKYAACFSQDMEAVKKQSEISEAEAKITLEKELAEAQDNPLAVAEARARYESKKNEIASNLIENVLNTALGKGNELSKKCFEEVLQKEEEKKKSKVDDDTRARLRGFARTIPSFLMAYGDEETTLANFDTIISDDVFKEVTGITLDQFRTLRDTCNFFNPIVFDESVQEFLNKKAALANYFDDSQSEDIFDYIPPQKTNQIFTPKKVVKLMIDKLEEENPGIFSNKEKTFADLYVKSGLYLTEIVKRLYTGLESTIPNKKKRLKHILEKQIFGFAPSEIIYRISRNYIFGNFPNIDDSNLKCQDLTETAKSGGDLEMKFDAVVGNPPYQEEAIGTSTKDLPIYTFFYDLAERTAPIYCLISPARFLFNAGGTNKKWNEKMLGDPHVKVLYHEQKSADVFPNTDIKGGIAVIFRNQKKNFGKIGTFTIFKELNSILSKVSRLTTTTLDEVITNRGQYRFSDKIYRDYPEEMKRITDRRISTNAFENLPNIFTDKKPSNGSEYSRILGRVGNVRGYKWFKREYLSEPKDFDKYKVILPKSNGSGAIGEVLSTPLVGEPLVGFTETFIGIGAFESEIEAQNCLKYVKSKFARTMLGILKVTQDNPRDKWAKVPLQDFTPNSDIDWTQSIPDIDQQLYKKYGLNKKEIAFIEEKVQAMK